MQTISVCCEGASIMDVVRKLKAMLWSHRRPSGHKLFGDGPVETYIYLLMTCRQSNFSYASVERIAAERGVDARTVKRWLKILRDNGFISRGRKFVSGYWRRGYYLNAHKWIVELLKTIKGVVVRMFGDSDAEAEASIRQAVQTTVNAQEPAAEKGQIGDKLSPQLTIRSGLSVKNFPPSPPLAAAAACAAKEREDADVTNAAGDVAPAAENPTWQAALALLLQRLPEAEVKLWLAPIRAMESETGLRLDCPDRYAMAHIEGRFGQAIGEALRQVGVEHFIFSFGVQQMELQREEERQERDKAAAEEKRRLEDLASRSWEDQFAVLASIYPRKTCGVWLAKKLFRRLHKRGELPEIGVLLKLVKEQAASEDWQRDRGRWIPGLYKWLQNRPWWNLDCKER